MRTQTLVQSSADIVQIVTLSPNDVYKRLGDRDYSGNDTLVFGVVTDVAVNDDNAMVTALEWDALSPDSTPRLRVFANDRELRIFAATPDEIATHVASVREAIDRRIRSAEVQLEGYRIDARRIYDLLDRLTHLSIPVTRIGADPTLELAPGEEL